MEKIIAVSLTLLASYLFTLGYVYLNAYYSRLGFSAGELGYTIQEILVHSTIVLTGFFKRVGTLQFVMWISLLLAVALFLIKRAFRGSKSVNNFLNDKRVNLAYTCCLASVASSIVIGTFLVVSNEGRIRADRALLEAKPLWIAVADSSKELLSPLEDSSAYLSFVGSTQDYVIGAIKYRDGSDTWLLRLHKDDLSHFRVYDDN